MGTFSLTSVPVTSEMEVSEQCSHCPWVSVSSLPRVVAAEGPRGGAFPVLPFQLFHPSCRDQESFRAVGDIPRDIGGDIPRDFGCGTSL